MTSNKIQSDDFIGHIILELSKTLQKAAALLRIKAAISVERSELVLEKYGIKNEK